MKFNELVNLCESDNISPIVYYWDNGNKQSEVYNNEHGGYHRVEGPAYSTWYENGAKHLEEYYIDNNLHRIDGPARIIWNRNGHKMYEYYSVNDNMHRLEGPAYLHYNEDGSIYMKGFFINGKRYTEEDFNEFLKGAETNEDKQALSDIKIDFD